MKKSILILVFIFSLFHIQISAQNYKILRSAYGELVGFRNLWNNNEFFGYFELHFIEKKDETTSRYKYIVLDKNMNEVSNGEFTIPRLVQNEMLSICQYNNGKILISIDGTSYSSVIRKNEVFKIIDLKSGTISDAISLIDKQLKIGAEVKPAPDTQNINQGIASFNIKNYGFLLTERIIKGSKSFYKTGTMIDLSGKKLWDIPLIPGESPNHFYEYSYFTSDDEVIALLGQYYKRKTFINDNLVILDAKTGDKLALRKISNEQFDYDFSFAKIFEDKIYILGEYYSKTGDDSQKTEYNKLGIYKKTYNKKTGVLLSDKKIPYSDLKKYIDIDEHGKVSKEGTLYFNDFEVRPDGTILVFGETYKSPNFFNAAYRFTELFSIVLNENFDIKELKSYNVNTTYAPKYSYGQTLKNNKGYVSFFIDLNAEKKVILNTLIYKDETNDFKMDKIELEKKNSDIDYFPAKNGYVGIIEYFKKTKTEDRFAELRLEKINVE